MADSAALLGDVAPPPREPSGVSSCGDCVAAILKLLSDLHRQLNSGEAALRMEVNPQLSSAARVYACLQDHIAKLQLVSEDLKLLVDSSTNSSASEEAARTSPVRERAPVHGCQSSEAAEKEMTAADVMVQIKAGKSEIERRISAFMERKQMEINENNVREFCNVIDCNQENSCARTDAVFTPYPGFKSHVKVSRVVNTYGPQTGGPGGGPTEAGEQLRGGAIRDCENAAIEERLQNIETHLKLPSAGPVPLSVFHRLKKLEDRILELEGLSPEYFQSTAEQDLWSVCE
ncbi:MAP3K12-binding inhibitory protein 1 isoform X2 [Oryzias melastigma]|uniref:MAP3K12-binding inhibitory protein 1 isoform X2 n=1 Tax=Oryzias melastigma TaxID=30732 RepID=UPI000CF7CDAB|nr:MAP3K12-binding inhibitory protein 1 isoform X2 [Oryzias melastigma]